MPGVPANRFLSLRLRALAAAIFAVQSASALAQLAPTAPPGSLLPPPVATPSDDIVQEIRVVGNRLKSTSKVLNEIGTRAGRAFDKEQLQKDVRKLASKSWFLDVKPEVTKAPGGLIITFKVVERPILEYVKYVGNYKVKAKTLGKQTELKAGMARDPYAVEEGRRRMEQYYQEKGFNGVTVTVVEGTKPNDRGAIYLINEGHSQKVWSVNFEGNTIATDARLKTQIQSKPPLFYIFKGQVDRKKIDEDVDRLTAYYRSLGFFRARIGREVEWDEEKNWAYLTFVIDEGPRYKVRNIAVMGNEKFASEQLTSDLKLHGGEFYDQNKMNADLGGIRDIYGSVGYVFADVQADTRFLEEPGQVDLVYNVAEGKRYRVGRIQVKIEGEHPHTRQQAVLNRISLRPGDIVDIRQLRASERRLRASGLFMNDATQGIQPKLVIVPPDVDGETGIAEREDRDGGVRGQSPDPQSSTTSLRGQSPDPLRHPWAAPDDVVINIGVDGTPIPSPEVDGFVPYVFRNPPRQPTQAPAGSTQQSQPQQQPHSAAMPVIRGQSPDNNPYRNGYQQQPVVRAQYTQPFGGRSITPQGPRPPVNSYPPASAPSPYTVAPADPYAQPLAPAAPPGPPPQPFTVPGNGEPIGAPPEYIVPPPPQPQPGMGGFFGQPQPDGLAAPPVLEDPDGYVDIDSVVQETQTGRFMFGVGVNSDAGLVGSIVIDEQNFDWRRWPTNGWEDFRNGTAFRGAGQKFRLEAAPGTQVQRYMANFSEPFLFDTPVSLGLSAFYFTRGYTDWMEERLGARTTLGYQFTPDLSGNVGLGIQQVDISNPRQPTPPQLAEVLGDTMLYTASTQIAHDTRDNTFLATEGHLIQLGFEQGFGDFVFPRFTADLRRFFTVRERPDGSGRHVLSLVGRFGISGSDTPIYERFYAGGFSSLRGFRFRGASPVDMDVRVGGDFQLLGSVEYMFPITADDMLRGVVFTDAGTVEESASIDVSNFRVAPGFGLRITVPALGPAPIALDFAFPVASAPDDQQQMFSFFVGFGR